MSINSRPHKVFSHVDCLHPWSSWNDGLLSNYFPVAPLLTTLRVHPALNGLPSSLFYEGRIVRCTSEHQRRMLTDLLRLPNPQVPSYWSTWGGSRRITRRLLPQREGGSLLARHHSGSPCMMNFSSLFAITALMRCRHGQIVHGNITASRTLRNWARVLHSTQRRRMFIRTSTLEGILS